METITVRICAGTTCFVMGASNLEGLEEHLSPEMRSCVNILHVPCLGVCENRNYGKAPFVEIDGDIVCQATLPELISEIEQRVASRGNREDRR